MTKTEPMPHQGHDQTAKEKRLAEQLRQNLRRRKALPTGPKADDKEER